MNVIRRMEDKDIGAVVDVHMTNFPNFFLTFLGKSFLHLMYREILREPGSSSLVAVSSDNGILGFVVGVSNQTGLFTRLARKKWYAFALASSASAIRHPTIIPRLFRALSSSRRSSRATCPALLMSIAVAQDARGNGLGKALVGEFINQMGQLGIDDVSLTTDRDDNEYTNRFYHRYGFSLVRQYQTPEGRWMNEYTIKTKRPNLENIGNTK